MDLEHEKRLTEVESRSKSNMHRLDEVERRQDNLDELVGTVKVLAVREENIEKDVKEMKDDVKTLTNKPVKRVDKLIDGILWGVVGAVLAFLLAKIGL